MSNWLEILLEPAKLVLAQIGRFLTNVLLVGIILLIGVVVSRVIKSTVIKVLRVARLDEFSARYEVDNILGKGGIKYSLSELVGVVCYWLSILVTFVVALTSVGLMTATLLDRVVSYIPNVILSIFILVIGMFIAVFMRNVIQTTASNAGIANGMLLGKVAQTVVIVFAVLITLEQLKIGIRVSEITLSIALGSMGLGLALAFGLGCRDIAGRFVAELIDKLKKK